LNWDTAFLHWYNADSSEYDYAVHEVRTGETILEVALAYYFAGDALLFHSYLKVVDPSTRKVIGRTYNFESIQLSEAQSRTLFSDNGQTFEELFRATGQRLIQKGLIDKAQ
jgi:hypothetical protein